MLTKGFSKLSIILGIFLFAMSVSQLGRGEEEEAYYEDLAVYKSLLREEPGFRSFVKRRRPLLVEEAGVAERRYYDLTAALSREIEYATALAKDEIGFENKLRDYESIRDPWARQRVWYDAFNKLHIVSDRILKKRGIAARLQNRLDRLSMSRGCAAVLGSVEGALVTEFQAR